MKAGTLVKWAKPMDHDEARERFRVVEDRGDRILVADDDRMFAAWRIRPQYEYRAVDLVAVEEGGV